MLKLLLLFVPAFLITSGLFSKEYRFDYIGVEQGLSDPTIRSIYQDEINRMWFATHDGLNCYDGNTVREFRQQIGENVTINTHRISDIIGDKHGNMFLRSNFGVIHFDLRTEKMSVMIDRNVNAIHNSNGFLWVAYQNFIQQFNTTTRAITAAYQLPYPDLRVLNIVDDKKGTLWLATQNYGLLQFSVKKKKVISRLESTSGRVLLIAKDGSVWYATQNDGVYVLHPRTLRVIRHFQHNPSDDTTIASGFNRSITQDRKGNIWIGTNTGLSCIEAESFKISRFKSTPVPNSLTSSSINCLYTDNRGTVWIGTYFGGVNYFNPTNQNYNYLVSTEVSKPTYPAIGTFCEDGSGTIWVGSEGGGMYRYNPAEQNLEYFTETNSGLSSDYIKKILPDPDGKTLWVAVDQSGELNKVDLSTTTISRIKIKPTEGNSPRALFALAATNRILFLGTDVGVIAFDKQTGVSTFVYRQNGQFSANTNDLFIDSKNRLWFAVNNFPVSYSLATSEFTYYTYNIIHSQLESNGITNIFYEDKKGQLWLGTNGYGLLALNESDKSFGYTDEFILLRDRSIMSMAETQKNHFLIATIQALYTYNRDDKSLTRQSFKTGFPLKALIKRGLYVSSTGDIYIGGIPTMVIYKESELVTTTEADEIQLTSLFVNNQEVLPGDPNNILKYALPFTKEIALKPYQNYITLMYSTDNYFRTNDDQIEYRLKGYDQSWNESNLGHAISYTSLSPGTYSFEIRSKVQPDKVRSLRIKVASPFYATFWAFLFYAMVMAVVAYFLVREYHTRVKLKASLAYQEREKQQIEEMNQSKIRFFINVSHEIRTPVTIVLAQTETLLNSPHLQSKTRSKLLNIHRHLLSLKHLITELMDFRKQERGELKLRYSETDLISMLREHYNLFKGLAESRNIEFSFVSPIEKLRIWIDSEQMIKVINNLTINAIKFTKEGGSVSVSVEENDDTVSVVFEDNGVGIPSAELDKIFNRFYQAENSEGTGGTGIGLALSKGIVDAHGGTIVVHSEEGKGSKFILSLPKGMDHVPAEQQNQPKEPIAAQYQLPDATEINQLVAQETEIVEGEERPLVLIVEDNNELRELLASTLSSVYTIETASDGQEGWEKVRDMVPQLVITDVMMPRMSGVDLCSRIKKNYELCHIPVVLLTARQSSEYEIEGLRIGADSYLTKPFEIKKLVIVSNNLIQSRRLIQKKFEQNRKFDVEIPATNEHDKEFINQVTAIIQDHLEDEKFDVERLAREIGVSRSKLFSKIKSIAGTTPNAIIQEIRLKKAADYLLNNPEMNIADIAYKLGFNSPRYFNKCFKETFGVAPLHFKKENKK